MKEIELICRRGFTLMELAVVLGIIAMIAACIVPAFMNYRRRTAVRAAALQVRTVFHQARSRAIARGHHSGLKFVQSGNDWTYAVYDDGDGDGVRNDDIARGTDRCVFAARRVLDHVRLASMSLPSIPILDPDGQWMQPNAPAVQFNRSTICSFSPRGESTPGTLYLTDHAGELFAVRVYGATAKMRLLRYDGATRKWWSQ